MKTPTECPMCGAEALGKNYLEPDETARFRCGSFIAKWDMELVEQEDCLRTQLEQSQALNNEFLIASKAFVESWEKCLQLEKTDTALKLAKDVIAKAERE